MGSLLQKHFVMIGGFIGEFLNCDKIEISIISVAKHVSGSDGVT